MADKDELFGRSIRDFVLGELIGEGGFGKAYRGEQPTLGREVVVKVLHRRLRTRDILLQRFLREAQLASRLDHPFAAHIYGVLERPIRELPSRAQVPPLGGDFPPALDQVFQRALAERPGDRFGTALELAGALRAASGLGASRADLPKIDLPKIDAGVRDAWLAGAPQPLAESVAVLDGARNAHQACIAAQELARGLLRYLLAVALATRAETRDSQDDPALLKLVRALAMRELIAEERVRLLRLLVRPLASRRGAHPIPELVDLVTPGPGDSGGLDDGLDPILALHGALDHAGTEDVVRSRLGGSISQLIELLRRTAFVLDYQLVVPRNHAAERWTGHRRQPREPASVLDGALIDGHPMLLDRTGRVCVDLWPLVQAVAPTEGAEPELFVFGGHGRHGALLIAAPAGLEHQDAVAHDWVATHVVAEIETKLRMRDQIRVAAHQWQRRDRPNALLWRGEVLADLERWTRHTAGATALGEPDASFVAASRRAGRRARWIRRLLVASVVAAALGMVEHRSAMKERMAEEKTTQAEVEAGRQALLHDDSAEAQFHLSEAYRRGDHSAGTVFMLSRALQPRLAEQARFASSFGRMWSATFSPDGKQIVTTDDKNAQIWDAQTYQLLFTLHHGDTVRQAVYSNDGTRIITAGGDGTVRIWNAASGTLARDLTHGGEGVRYGAVAASSDGKLVASIDIKGEVVHVWDTVTGALLTELPNNASEFFSLAFSADGRWLATSGGNDVRVFDVWTWVKICTLAGQRRLSWDPTGPRLLTGSADGDVSIWAIPSGSRLRHLREIGEPVNRVAFSPNGELVVAASDDGAEHVWNATSGKLRSQGNYLRGKILSVEFDRTSTLVVAAGASGLVAVVDAALGRLVTMLDGPRNVVMVAHFDPSSQRVIGASWDGTARIWDATAPYRRWSSPSISDDCGLITSLEPDRRFLAIGCRDHNTRIWDTVRDQLIAELPSVTQVSSDFASAYPAVSAAGDHAAIARGNTVEIYELPGGKLARSINHGAAVNTVAFASTGSDLVSGAVDGSLLVTRGNGAVLALPTSSEGIDAAGFLADGRVVAADAQRRLRVYAPGGAILADLEVSARVRTLRMSSDSRRLITVPSFMGKAAPPEVWDLEHIDSLPNSMVRVKGRYIRHASLWEIRS